MDFENKYTVEQQAFRVVVSGWLSQNFPQGLNIPPDGRPLDVYNQDRVKDFRRKLGNLGWLAPYWPREYGGGGLPQALGSVIQEELGMLDLPSLGDNYRWIPAVMAWGTQEQKLRYVPPALRGETITWQAFTEPESGSDLATVHTRAVPEDGGYRISGEKAFVTGRFDPDYLVTLAVTDPDRPAKYNLGVFMVDARLSGVSIKTMRLLMGSERRIYFDGVYVPEDCMIGPPFQGWEIALTIIEAERGGAAYQVSDDGTVEGIYRYLRDQRTQQDS